MNWRALNVDTLITTHTSVHWKNVRLKNIIIVALILQLTLKKPKKDTALHCMVL